MSEILVDRARLADLQAVHNLALARGRAATSHEDSDRRGFLPSSLSMDDYRDLLEYAEHFYVAHTGRQLVGFVVACSGEWAGSMEWLHAQLARFCGKYLFIWQICVEPSDASRRIAADLYLHVIERSAATPIASGTVAESFNGFPAELHRELGFRPTLSLTPPDGVSRIVWLREPTQARLLEYQLSLAMDLYKHEDNLNWNKLNNFLYVTTACVALLALALGKSAGERLSLCVATCVLGMISSASFGITLWAGVTYLHTRKDAARDIESLMLAHGCFPLLAAKSETGTRRYRILSRSPTANVLRLIPLFVGLGWTACLTVALLAYFR
jgi:ribosomal protein S18 acetylase RimI-like enzyme